MISTDLFPYENHPYRLEFGEGKNTTICWFECEEHLQKHLTRYKIDTKVVKIDYRDEKPIKPSKKHKGSVEQKPKPKSNGSVGTNKGRKPSVDSSRNTTRAPKPKK